VIGLGSIVGLALVGADHAAEGVAVTPSPLVTDEPSAAARSLELDQPAHRGQVVTTREIVVKGRVARDVGEVWIMLESRGGKPIATQAIDPTGMPRGDLIPFESRFHVAMPRPAGSLVVSVVAIGADGTPVEAIRRRFELGAVIDIPRPLAD
jgi:hypothetical protein